MKLWLKKRTNIRLLLLSLGLSCFVVSIQKIMYPVVPVHLPKIIKIFLKAILDTHIDNLIWSMALMIIGLIILFILLADISNDDNSNKQLYYYWMITGIICTLAVIVFGSTKLLFLLNCVTWIIFTFVWIVNKLYSWIVSDHRNMLAKLTFFGESLLHCWDIFLNKSR